MLIAVGAGGMDSAGRTLLMGDDGSEAADVAWLWINEHDRSGWRIEVVHLAADGDPEWFSTVWIMRGCW
jgi:hypothetical protein